MYYICDHHVQPQTIFHRGSHFCGSRLRAMACCVVGPLTGMMKAVPFFVASPVSGLRTWSFGDHFQQ